MPKMKVIPGLNPKAVQARFKKGMVHRQKVSEPKAKKKISQTKKTFRKLLKKRPKFKKIR